jgi:hypothetical protein
MRLVVMTRAHDGRWRPFQEVQRGVVSIVNMLVQIDSRIVGATQKYVDV